MRVSIVALSILVAMISGCTTTETQKKSASDPPERIPFHHYGRLEM